MLICKKFSLIFLLILCGLAWSQSITTLPTKEKIIALTFDDGPKNGASEQLLDLLASENIQATFFIIGESIENDPDLVYRLNKNGHDIGNHTFSHTRLDTLSYQKILIELQKNNNLISKITKTKVKYFRAPGGRYSDNVEKAAKKLNLKIINWSLNPGDYMLDSPIYEKGEAVFVRSAEILENDLLQNVKPGDIILLHTGNIETIDALRIVIPELKKQGYRFAKISEFY